MALPIFQRTVVDDAGNVLAGATVTITNEATGTAATIYSDRNGSVPLTNPFTTGSDGLARFYAAAGEYRVQASLGGTAVDWRYQVLTGTAARSDVTTSSTDTTVGRLLKVGDFGVGVTSSSDLNGSIDALLATGIYQLNFSVNTTGAKPEGIVIGVLEHYTRNNGSGVDRHYQVLHGHLFGVPKTYRRSNIGGTWSSWQEILHTGNMVGTVNSSKTGSIIERGSNANGEYVKFADGTMECWGYYAAGSGSMTDTFTVNGFNTFRATVTFPVSFTATPVFICGGGNNSIGQGFASKDSQSSTTANGYFRYWTTASSFAGTSVYWKAIGRWY